MAANEKHETQALSKCASSLRPSESRLVRGFNQNSHKRQVAGDQVVMNGKVEVGGVLETVMYAGDLEAIADFYAEGV